MAVVNKFNVNREQVTLDVIYDVTTNNSSVTFESLQSLLSSPNLDTLIPTSVRHGGMSIRFVQSSDNKYVQFRFILSTFTTAQFANVTNWIAVGVEEIINLTAITNSVEDSGVSKVGDMYYNTLTTKLRQCTVYNTSPSDSIYETIDKQYDKIYKCDNVLYVFKDENLIEITPNKYIKKAYGRTQVIVELYLEGLDSNKDYTWNTLKFDGDDIIGVLVETSTNTALASFASNGLGITVVSELNSSGISGYIIINKNATSHGMINKCSINVAIVSNLDESPSIKTYKIINGDVIVGKAKADSYGKTLVGTNYGKYIKDLYIPSGVLTSEQITSVNKARIYNGFVSSGQYIYGIQLYHNSTSVLKIYFMLPTEAELLKVKDVGVVSTPIGSVALSISDLNVDYIDVDILLASDVTVLNINSPLKEYIDDYSEGSHEVIVTPSVTFGYMKINGTIQSTNNYIHSSIPIFLHKGDTIKVFGTELNWVTSNISVIYSTDRNGNFESLIQDGVNTGSYCYTYTAVDDMWIGVSYKKDSAFVSVVEKNTAMIIHKLHWLEHSYISSDGLHILYSSSNVAYTEPFEVFEGDVLTITEKAINGTCVFAESTKDGCGIYDIRGRDDRLTPLVVANATGIDTFEYIVDHHSYIVVTADVTDGEPTLYIRRRRENNNALESANDFNSTRYIEKRRYYVDECQFVPNIASKKYNSILTYSADDKYGGGTSSNSNYIANAVVYPNGDILACRNGGAVVKILNDSTEIAIQYNGSDMVITGASDWRGVFMSKNGDVFISPHSSQGRGDSAGIAIEDRGIYKIANGTNVATKVLNLYNDAATMVSMWESSTVYNVGDVVWYVNHCYKCITSHTSTTSFDTDKFSRLPNFTGNTLYHVGDIVQLHDNDFECITEHTSDSSWTASEQNNWVAAASCMNGQNDTIWTFCEDDKGNLYAGVYAHLTRRQPVIYKSADNGNHWRYIFNFATNADVEIDTSWPIIQGPRHIHGITFNEYDNCLYCACGETNTVWKSSDYGISWKDMKVGGYEGKPTSVIGVPDGIIIGSDGQWGCALTKIYTDGNARMVGRIWASFIFYIRRSDLTGWLYAFSRLDNVIASKGNGTSCPPVEAMTNPAVLESWWEQASRSAKQSWGTHHEYCEKYYPEDAIIPHHGSIMVSKDNGDTWEILRYEDVGTNGSSGFFTIGYFRDGECLCGLISDNGRESGNIYVKPIIISEGKKKRTNDGYDLTGEIFIKLNTSNIVDY